MSGFPQSVRDLVAHRSELLCERIETASKERWNAPRGLTHESVLAIGGLAVNATRICTIDGCDRPLRVRELCDMHYQRVRNSGSPDLPTRATRAIPTTTRRLVHGDSIPATEARRYRHANGYILLRWLVAPCTYVEAFEHRVALGLPPENLEVHHINGVKTDNRRENLVALSKSDHAILHALSDPGWAARAKRPARVPLAQYPRCNVGQCDRPAQCLNRTLCLMHYKRERRAEFAQAKV